MKSRTRLRTPNSIGSNQLSKRWGSVSAPCVAESGCVICFFMAWSPARRVNARRFEVEHPGDYATLNSYQPPDGTFAQMKWSDHQSAVALCDRDLHRGSR